MPQRSAGPSTGPRTIVSLLAMLALAAGCGDSTSPEPSATGSDSMPNSMPMDTSSGALTDGAVLDLAAFDSTWTWWEFSDSLLDRAGNSPHAERIRVRYNGQAATQLDSVGRLVARADFPDNSIVVKEVHDTAGPTSTLVMVKAEGDPNAGHGAWLWGEYAAADGSTLHSITDDDSVCHNCHVAGTDHMRMPDTH